MFLHQVEKLPCEPRKMSHGWFHFRSRSSFWAKTLLSASNSPAIATVIFNRNDF